MDRPTVEVFAQRAPWSSAVEVLIAEVQGDQRYVAKPLEMVPVGDEVVMQETFRLPHHAAQALMDQLWNCGIRPTEGSGSAGSLAATQRHLQDMQAVAFGLLKQHGVER